MEREQEQEQQLIHFTVVFKKEVFQIEFSDQATIANLKELLSNLTAVAPALQKLLFKGQLQNESTLAESGIIEGSKLMLVGSSQAEIDKLDPKKPIVDKPVKPVAPSRRAVFKTLDDLQQGTTPFGQIQVLPWPNSEKAKSLLTKLSNDPGIVAVMKSHNWHVGVLSELTPLNVTKLGFNMNRGMEISLRLRFEDGFREYNNIKEVLYHELAHMEISEHDDKFKTLCSQIRREAQAFGSQAQGRRLDDRHEYYEAPLEPESVDSGGEGYVLGGKSSSASDPREAAHLAALARLNGANKPASGRKEK